MTGPVVRVGTAETRDGALLSWRVDGEGELPPLVCSNGIGVSTFFWKHLAVHFAPRRAVVTWDYRGHGQSPVPPDPDALGVVQCARDLWTVVDGAGFSDAVLVGHSMGAQVSLEALRLRRDRVKALVPVLGAAGRVLDTFLGLRGVAPLASVAIALGSRAPHVAERLLRASLKAPGMWEVVKALGFVHPDLCPREEFEPYFAHLAKLDLRGYFALARDLLTHDASDLLPGITVPALVVAGERDLFTPLERSRELSQAIPGAELLVIRGGSHAALVEQPELVCLAVEKFLRKHHLA